MSESSTQSNEWYTREGEWFVFTGNNQRIPTGVIVEVQRSSGRYDTASADEIKWDNVLAYRVISSGEPSTKQTKANDIQVAGDHYRKLPIQTWDFIAANNIGFFEGNAIKYLTRWQSKGGVEDLRKAKHYIEKLIEIHTKEAA